MMWMLMCYTRTVQSGVGEEKVKGRVDTEVEEPEEVAATTVTVTAFTTPDLS